MDVLTTTKKRMFSYQELVESWRNDHLTAKLMDKLEVILQQVDFEGLLREGMLLWESLTDVHQSLLESISSGEIEPNLMLEKQIWLLYQQWLEHTGKLKTVLQCFTERDFKFEHSAAFLECLEEATEYLSGISEPHVAIGSFVGFPSLSCD